MEYSHINNWRLVLSACAASALIGLWLLAPSAGATNPIASQLYNHRIFAECRTQRITHTHNTDDSSTNDIAAEFTCVYLNKDYRAAEILGEALVNRQTALNQQTLYWLANSFYLRGNNAQALHYSELAYSRLSSSDKSGCTNNIDRCADIRSLLGKLDVAYRRQFAAEDAAARRRAANAAVEANMVETKEAILVGVLFILLTLVLWRVYGRKQKAPGSGAQQNIATTDADAQAQAALSRIAHSGELQPIVPANIVSKKGEVFYWSQPAKLVTTQIESEHVGGYAGGSVRIARGLWFRSGGIRGHTEKHPVTGVTDTGTVYLSNQRMVFVGAQGEHEVTMSHIGAVHPFPDGMRIDIVNRLPVAVQTGDARLGIIFERIMRGDIHARTTAGLTSSDGSQSGTFSSSGTITGSKLRSIVAALKPKVEAESARYNSIPSNSANAIIVPLSDADAAAWMRTKLSELMAAYNLLKGAIVTDFSAVISATDGASEQRTVEQFVNKIEMFCDQLIEWEQNVRAVSFSPQLEPLRNSMKGLTASLFAQAQKLLDALTEGLNHLGEVNPLKITLEYKVSEDPHFQGFAAELGRLGH
jgi:hypothetical protein